MALPNLSKESYERKKQLRAYSKQKAAYRKAEQARAEYNRIEQLRTSKLAELRARLERENEDWRNLLRSHPSKKQLAASREQHKMDVAKLTAEIHKLEGAKGRITDFPAFYNYVQLYGAHQGRLAVEPDVPKWTYQRTKLPAPEKPQEVATPIAPKKSKIVEETTSPEVYSVTPKKEVAMEETKPLSWYGKIDKYVFGGLLPGGYIKSTPSPGIASKPAQKHFGLSTSADVEKAIAKEQNVSLSSFNYVSPVNMAVGTIALTAKGIYNKEPVGQIASEALKPQIEGAKAVQYAGGWAVDVSKAIGKTEVSPFKQPHQVSASSLTEFSGEELYNIGKSSHEPYLAEATPPFSAVSFFENFGRRIETERELRLSRLRAERTAREAKPYISAKETTLAQFEELRRESVPLQNEIASFEASLNAYPRTSEGKIEVPKEMIGPLEQKRSELMARQELLQKKQEQIKMEAEQKGLHTYEKNGQIFITSPQLQELSKVGYGAAERQYRFEKFGKSDVVGASIADIAVPLASSFTAGFALGGSGALTSLQGIGGKMLASKGAMLATAGIIGGGLGYLGVKEGLKTSAVLRETGVSPEIAPIVSFSESMKPISSAVGFTAGSQLGASLLSKAELSSFEAGYEEKPGAIVKVGFGKKGGTQYTYQKSRNILTSGKKQVIQTRTVRLYEHPTEFGAGEFKIKSTFKGWKSIPEGKSIVTKGYLLKTTYGKGPIITQSSLGWGYSPAQQIGGKKYFELRSGGVMSRSKFESIPNKKSAFIIKTHHYGYKFPKSAVRLESSQLKQLTKTPMKMPSEYKTLNIFRVEKAYKWAKGMQVSGFKAPKGKWEAGYIQKTYYSLPGGKTITRKFPKIFSSYGRTQQVVVMTPEHKTIRFISGGVTKSIGVKPRVFKWQYVYSPSKFKGFKGFEGFGGGTGGGGGGGGISSFSIKSSGGAKSLLLKSKQVSSFAPSLKSASQASSSIALRSGASALAGVSTLSAPTAGISAVSQMKFKSPTLVQLPKSTQSLKTTPISAFTPITISTPATSTASKTATETTTTTTPITTPITTPSFGFGGTPASKSFFGRGFLPVLFPYGYESQYKKKKRSRKLYRTPSFAAVALGITAPKPFKGEITGLVERPIIVKSTKRRTR